MFSGPPLVTVVGGLLMMGAVLLGLRWTFGTGREQAAPHVPDPDDPTGDGLLEEVARVPTKAAAHVLRYRLAEAGIRATIGSPGPAYRLLVFPSDLVEARIVLSRHDVD